MIPYFVSTRYLFLSMYFDPNDHTVSYKPVPVSAHSRVCLFSCVPVLVPTRSCVRLFPFLCAPVPALACTCSRSRAHLFLLSCAPIPALARTRSFSCTLKGHTVWVTKRDVILLFTTQSNFFESEVVKVKLENPIKVNIFGLERSRRTFSHFLVCVGG